MTTLTFNVSVPSLYPRFVTQMRDAVKDPKTTYYDLNIIKKPDPKNKYLYVQVNAASENDKPAISVTLQLQTKDLYIVAYRDRDQLGKDRAFYFAKMITENEAFPGEKINREVMKFDHDYESIQNAANKRIENLVFQLPNLEDAMRKAYGMNTGDYEAFKKAQALFVLYSIEMTAEAARFEYIRRKTVEQQQSDFTVSSLVQEWNKLSEQIVWSKDGNFGTPITVKHPDGTPWTVKTVAEIKPYMGILSYVEPKKLETLIDDELSCLIAG
ncbi:hypothetical protein RND81_14G002800 [Saponaria officinalis]|uniref:rRNA N-glycosylase n=1 Tax=Saponaria officinalis TaxID=3572 RepID=A0AAW1GJG0_SAPOF